MTSMGNATDRTTEKRERLFQIIRKAGPMVIAFSGGVDSCLLLTVAHDALGSEVVAATAVSDIHSRRQTERARAWVQRKKIPHVFFSSGEIHLPAFSANQADRCYHCKLNLFEALWQIAGDRKLSQVAHGANADDLDDFRPGMEAARKMNVRAPLIEAELRKQDIRSLAKEIGLPSWNQPATPCLATRIPFGTPITLERLNMVDQAENVLFDMGIEECRVRHHGTVARLELSGADIGTVMGNGVRQHIVARLRDIGFHHVTLDLEPHVSGGMNRVLGLNAHAEVSR